MLVAGAQIDSILGATVQFSGYSEQQRKVVNSPKPTFPGEKIGRISGIDLLDNHQVR